ncbi:response regulator [Bacillus sp. B15-48]|nr:response regulator [Bacillus sp. B15-48]
MTEEIKQDNYKVFALLSKYLNDAPDFIEKEEVDELVESGVSYEYAFALLLAAAFGLDIVDNVEDKEFFNHYFTKMIHKLDVNEYANNPYYQQIHIPTVKIGDSELKYEKFKAYEGFVCNDIIQTKQRRQIPQIGFFQQEFKFPAILEKERIWMTITPNEIETMREPVEQAVGNVLTFGLGLGYYAYMVSEKESVESVTIVDNNQEIIDLFQQYILPQFKNKQKVTVIKADAFKYAETDMAHGKYDFVFTDLWHDVSDGIEMYLKMKTYEKQCPDTVFTYWIEKSILCYL